MATQIPLDNTRAAEDVSSDHVHEIAPDLAYRRTTLVNVLFFGLTGASDRNWVLIDAGIPGSGNAIRDATLSRFGSSRPAAIIVTHGHFDHVGALEELALEWDAPVFAHPLEQPYLDGTSSYPPPDTGAGGGVMPMLSPLFPRSPVNVGERLQLLPSDGSVPFMPDWVWLHVPGHTPGQIALWRARDKTLIAADAVITTGQESAYEVALQSPQMHGPPRYFTPDWTAAGASVAKLAALKPELLITGHGRAMSGPSMRAALERLDREFWSVAVPPHLRERT